MLSVLTSALGSLSSPPSPKMSEGHKKMSIDREEYCNMISTTCVMQNMRK